LEQFASQICKITANTEFEGCSFCIPSARLHTINPLKWNISGRFNNILHYIKEQNCPIRKSWRSSEL